MIAALRREMLEVGCPLPQDFELCAAKFHAAGVLDHYRAGLLESHEASKPYQSREIAERIARYRMSESDKVMEKLKAEARASALEGLGLDPASAAEDDEEPEGEARERMRAFYKRNPHIKPGSRGVADGIGMFMRRNERS